MTQDRKTFGMTTSQLGILAGLAGLVCLLFGITGWLVIRGSFKLPFLQQPATTVVPQLTATPFFLPTLAPTATPTPVPYEERIPQGWKQFKTDLVEIWLPVDFELADVDRLMKETRKSYAERGLQELIDYNAQNESISNLVVTDEVSGSVLYRTIASISYRPLDEESLEILVEKELSELPSMIVLVEQKDVRIGSNEAIRLVYEVRMGNIYANNLEYVFLDGMTVWSVSYYAEITEFFQQLSIFEKSIQTFRTVQ